MAKAWVEEHEAVEVRIVRVKVLCPVNCVVVVHNGADLHAVPRVLNHCTKRIARGPGRKWKFIIPVRHSLRPNEDEVKARARKEMSKLCPGISWEGGLGARTENE